MSAKAGFGGSITFTGLTVGVRAWAINTVAAALDVTTYLSARHKEFIPGLDEWAGTMAALWDTANNVVAGDTGSLTAYPASGTADPFTGQIIITGVDYASAHDGIVEAAVTFQGTAALTIA